jgi:hypothetical protein
MDQKTLAKVILIINRQIILFGADAHENHRVFTDAEISVISELRRLRDLLDGLIALEAKPADFSHLFKEGE